MNLFYFLSVGMSPEDSQHEWQNIGLVCSIKGSVACDDVVDLLLKIVFSVVLI